MIGLLSAIRGAGGGLHKYGFTVFLLPISQDLGLSRAATSLAFSLSRAQGAIEAPLVGYLIDRFGPRPIIRICPFADGHRQQLVYPSTSVRHDRRQRWEISTAASTSQRFAAC